MTPPERELPGPATRTGVHEEHGDRGELARHGQHGQHGQTTRPGDAAPPASGEVVGRAVVLGPGGPIGTAWMAGLAHGLRRAGVNLAEADLIVGTSAGAIVGALITSGQNLDRLGSLVPATPAATTPAATTANASRATTASTANGLADVFALLSDRSLDPAAARRRVGQLALAAATGSEAAHLAQLATLINVEDWPRGRGRLLVTAVNIETGEPALWDRSSGVPLPVAVAASCSMPTLSPPVTVDGQHYMDGALRAGSNADLTGDAAVLIVIEPGAPSSPAPTSSAGSTGNAGSGSAGSGSAGGTAENAGTADGEEGGRIVRIAPDDVALEAFGPSIQDLAAWNPAFHAGVRQAADVSRRLRAVWNHAEPPT
jgi:NTE family protein